MQLAYALVKQPLLAKRGCEVHKVTRLQLRRVGGSATREELDRDDTGDGLAPRLSSH